MLETAMEAAAAAGKFLRENFGGTLTVNESTHRDIKLEVDVQTQALITRIIRADYPDHAILGEEGVSGDARAEVRWVVDPLDGTVNYFYNIPLYAVSIAAQQRTGIDDWQTVAGVVYAPELDEMFAAERGKPATLNGSPIHVSTRDQWEEAIVTIGFFKNDETIRRALADFQHFVHRVRKIRLLGSAALDAAYVAAGRFDLYIEYGIKLWDICAGELILECAGGRSER
ncbi:MAG: inositol monophosphatase, partial [Verrucomicrobiae bacterium]|nr:inositol monophosphatase [Verrucomicrobiae bacterium]